MRREGRQHGMVRCYSTNYIIFGPQSRTRFVNRFDSPPTTGSFTKVPSKPTNHSKFTGRCPFFGYHLNPSSKSKHKVKGAHRLRSTDVVIGFSGLSVTRALDHIAGDGFYEDEGGDDDEEEEDVVVGDYYSVSPRNTCYSFADLFRCGGDEEGEIGVCEGDWVCDDEFDEAFISEMMGLGIMEDYQVVVVDDDDEDDDGGWFFVDMDS